MSGIMLRSGRDRWLLSYADFITVLFAAFVLMYAAARAKERAGPLPGPGVINTRTGVGGAPVQSNLLTDLRKTLQLEQNAGVVTVTLDQRGVIVALDDKMCFQPGKAEIETGAIPMFEKVARVLSRHNTRVLLEGHTDSVPIHNAQFRSNWELSTARSIAVMELMESQGGIPGQRFLIGGSADNAPVSTNETERGRAHNRRVEIVALDAAEPGSEEARHPAVTW